MDRNQLPLCVLKSGAGYYIGTADDAGPVSRESEEYWRSEECAQLALDKQLWTPRLCYEHKYKLHPLAPRSSE
jgi:hypothetical protein